MPRLSVQLLTIVVFAFTLYFIWDFSQRVVTSIHLDQTAEQAQLAVDHAQATQAALIEKRKLVASPQYVETVARSWHWAKENEKVVIPEITPAPTPTVSLPTPTPTPVPSWWQQIGDFLFGSP